MTFLSPWWLLAVGPVMGLAVYLFRGKSQAASVPFLQLWGKPAAMPRVQSSLRLPPLCLILLLISMLLGIIAAAGPMLKMNRSAGSITIILDRGITMSPTSADGGAYRGVVDDAAVELAQKSPSASVQLMPIPGEVQQTDIEHWSSIAAKFAPTALDTAALLDVAVATRLREHPGQPVVVLSDRHLMSNNALIFQECPKNEVSNVGISLMAARVTPSPQLMVQLHNHAAKRNVRLMITLGAKSIEKEVNLTANDETQNVFIDLPAVLTDVLKAELVDAGEAAATHSAWLVRNHSFPRIDAISALPPAVEKVMKAYSATTTADRNSPHVDITTGELSAAQTGVQLVQPGIHHFEARVEPVIADHAVTRAVSKWPEGADGNATAPAGYSTVVSENGKPVVAVQDSPVRKVWINLSLDSWSTTPDFVIFFTNVFDWLDQNQKSEYRFQLPGQIDGDNESQNPLWPGLYHRGDGEQIAINAPDIKWEKPLKTDWNKALSSAGDESDSRRSESTGFCIAALVFAVMGLALWPRHKRV